MTVPVEQQQALSFADEEAEFAQAWSNRRYTRITLEPVDVNRVLRERYTLARELTFTQAMLRDVEVRKARHPLQFIPTVVQEGHIWARQSAGNEERFLRASQQRRGLTGEVGLVLERVHLSHTEQRVIFLGAPELRDANGALQRSGARVEAVRPDEATEAVFASVDGNLLAPSVRERAARDGRAGAGLGRGLRDPRLHRGPHPARAAPGPRHGRLVPPCQAAGASRTSNERRSRWLIDGTKAEGSRSWLSSNAGPRPSARPPSRAHPCVSGRHPSAREPSRDKPG